MMRKTIYILAIICGNFNIIRAQIIWNVEEPADWVNPLMGTDSKYSLSNGNTYPVIALPWGMNFWTPQTAKMGDGWVYNYNDNKIEGFKQTHQPSPWMNDYGQFSIMPVVGPIKINEHDRASFFSHKTEIVKPYYYSVYLSDPDITAEFSPTERACSFQFTFPETDSAYIIVDAFDKGSYIKIIPSEKKLIGYTTKNSGGVPANFKNYFVMYFDKPIQCAHTWHDGILARDTLTYQANHTIGIIGFKTSKGEKIHVKVASSFISYEQAEQNMINEIGKDKFDQTRQKAKNIWNHELKKILVSGGTNEQIKTFYSCLYRVLLFPRKFYEIDNKKNIVHYSPYNGQVLDGYMYTDNGFWDTFRAVFPFFTLMYPTHNAHIMEGLVSAYKESGWLPEWASPGHRDCMIGSNSATLVADAYLKGIRGYDINTLYEAILKNTENEGPLSSVGRKGVAYYNSLGYIPYNVGIKENTARTLEYAYDDFTIYKLAKALNRPKAEIERFGKRCQNYSNVFDPETELMRGKNDDGKFQTPFNPFKWGDAFTEGNSWHYTWSVFHDIEGLSELMGGKKKFVNKLDSVFKMPPSYDASYYGGIIHEILEMKIMNMGQYAHGNQPIQHMTYLYNYARQPWKTQYWVRQIMNKLYKATPDGYCGDEDNGQTSAWYVFSSIGFYPVCPGTPQYVFGAPLFKKVTLSLENGKIFTIEAPRNNEKNMYINRVILNGSVYSKNWINHFDITKGGKLIVEMSSIPNKQRGISTKDYPYSFSTEK